MFFLIIGIIVFVTILYLYSHRETRLHSFIGFILLSSIVNFDIENLLRTSFQERGNDLSCEKEKDRFIITQGRNLVILHIGNEPVGKEAVETLILSSPGLNYEEINLLKTHLASIIIHAQDYPKNSAEVSFAAQVILVLLKQGNAVGLVNGTTQRYYPLSRFDTYMSETILRPEEFYFLFDKSQGVKRGK